MGVRKDHTSKGRLTANDDVWVQEKVDIGKQLEIPQEPIQYDATHAQDMNFGSLADRSGNEHPLFCPSSPTFNNGSSATTALILPPHTLPALLPTFNDGTSAIASSAVSGIRLARMPASNSLTWCANRTLGGSEGET